ncbi:hypothetical protein GCM10010466_64480 [Planomonospora alba]|uniref:Uncharacterized protein n=1 Tax=Planomonospora alba TaxID=161354 RepID=A0ABP6P2L9_9ACTN
MGGTATASDLRRPRLPGTWETHLPEEAPSAESSNPALWTAPPVPRLPVENPPGTKPAEEARDRYGEARGAAGGRHTRRAGTAAAAPEAHGGPTERGEPARHGEPPGARRARKRGDPRWGGERGSPSGPAPGG